MILSFFVFVLLSYTFHNRKATCLFELFEFDFCTAISNVCALFILPCFSLVRFQLMSVSSGNFLKILGLFSHVITSLFSSNITMISLNCLKVFS